MSSYLKNDNENPSFINFCCKYEYQDKCITEYKTKRVVNCIKPNIGNVVSRMSKDTQYITYFIVSNIYINKKNNLVDKIKLVQIVGIDDRGFIIDNNSSINLVLNGHAKWFSEDMTKKNIWNWSKFNNINEFSL